jgi:hypothetical protein
VHVTNNPCILFLTSNYNEACMCIKFIGVD